MSKIDYYATQLAEMYSERREHGTYRKFLPLIREIAEDNTTDFTKVIQSLHDKLGDTGRESLADVFVASAMRKRK